MGGNPWLPLNEWQIRCNQCVQWNLHNGQVRIETDERGGKFIRFSSDHSKETVQKFVAENMLGVDWSKAFISSSGSIETRRFTRRIELWRLPIVGIGGYERQEIERAIEMATALQKAYAEGRPAPWGKDLREKFDQDL